MTKRHQRNFFFLANLNQVRGDTARPATESEIERAFRFSEIVTTSALPNTDSLLAALAEEMISGQETDGDIPAGYTYLGQFIDHDLTMDNTDVKFGANVSVTQLRQGRSPALDLDSLYGLGPDKEPVFYDDDRVKLKVGPTKESAPPDHPVASIALDKFDLPRKGNSTADPEEVRKAQIPDPRNDENLIVAQTHLAFIRFHNAVCEKLAPSTPSLLLFSNAKEVVVKHYQWMVRFDFLPRIVDNAILDDVFTNGRKIFEVDAVASPTMPIEFSVAAYRLGHSMIRDQYNWNAIFGVGGAFGDIGTLDNIFRFSATSGNLSPGSNIDNPIDGSFERLPTNWVADWPRLFDFVGDGMPDLAPEGGLNFARAINIRLTNPLKTLPLGAFGSRAAQVSDLDRNLAFRNLVRGRMVGLATGQEMVNRIQASVPGSPPPLSADQILGTELANLTDSLRAELVERTPLWFYILREAELNNGRLGSVGGRIVAETFHRAIEGSSISFIRDPSFRPSLGPDSDTFRMTDLLRVAYDATLGEMRPLSIGAGRPLAR
ncbi:heme peroxidase family protein [Massilia sp. CMS3.1]|uniref:peroxidase family protein n=1 Tax=Massilia sp. CMS3.1 TaxID=3373083 RepID=UPI003EE48C71